jgi:hypothetical protein
MDDAPRGVLNRPVASHQPPAAARQSPIDRSRQFDPMEINKFWHFIGKTIAALRCYSYYEAKTAQSPSVYLIDGRVIQNVHPKAIATGG